MEKAVHCVETIDEYRNLHVAIPIILFFTAAGFAIRSYFWLIDFTTWLGLDKVGSVPVLPAAISFGLLFVVWALTFFAFMSLMDHMNFRNVEALLNSQLVRLDLAPDEAGQLKEIVDSRTWRNDRLLKAVAAKLAYLRQ